MKPFLHFILLFLKQITWGMTNIQAEKINLIKIIASTEDGKLLHRIREVVEDVDATQKVWQLAEAPAERLDLEQLKKEQGYVTENVTTLHGQWFIDDDYFELLEMLD